MRLGKQSNIGNAYVFVSCQSWRADVTVWSNIKKRICGLEKHFNQKCLSEILTDTFKAVGTIIARERKQWLWKMNLYFKWKTNWNFSICGCLSRTTYLQLCLEGTKFRTNQQDDNLFWQQKKVAWQTKLSKHS